MQQDRLVKLESKVRDLYMSAEPGRAAEWADWLFANHVFVVADYAEKVALQKGFDAELARCAGFLHDIADIKMDRGSEHERASMDIARQLMQEFGYSDEEISIVVDDALKFHSCHGDERPKTDIGKTLSTADSLAHLTTDFYLFAVYMFNKKMDFESTKNWAREKIDRDYKVKVAFDDIREQYTQDYTILKTLFAR